jgi:hypothetical protein
MRKQLLAALVGLCLANPSAYAQKKKTTTTTPPPPTETTAAAPTTPPPPKESAQAGEDDNSGGTATLEEGLALFEKKKYHEAAKLFYQATLDETPEAAAFKQKAEFFLGKSLYSMGYLSASLAYFQRIAQSGPEHSYYRATLKYLAALANRLPNDAPLLDLIGLYTLEDFPEKNKEELSFLLGKYNYYQNNKDAAAALLSAVTSASPYFLEAKFHESIIYVRLATENEGGGFGQQAAETLKQMLRYIEEAKLKDDYKKKADYKAEIDRYEQLVDLTMGRVFYSNKQFQTSVKYFDKVDPESEFWLEALFSETWAYFQINGFDKALGHVHTLNSPYFESEFYPESLIVKSVIMFYNCRYDDAAAVEAKFEEIYKPVTEELKTYSEKFTENEQFYNFVAKFRKGKVSLTPRIQRIVTIALSDKALLKQFEQVEQIDQEQKKLKLDKKKWAEDKVASQIEQDLDIAKTFAISEAGLQVKNRFQRVQRELNDLIRQGIKIKFEVANAQAGQIDEELAAEQAAAATGGGTVVLTNKNKTPTKGKTKGGTFVDEEHAVWKFDREYWKDELGYYRSPIVSQCKKVSAAPTPTASNE